MPGLTWEEADYAMRSLKNGKAASPNGVRNEHIKHVSDTFRKAIYAVLVDVWKGGLPPALKVADLVSLP